MAKLGQGEVEAKRIMGMMFDPAFADGPFAKDRNVAKTYYEQAAAQGDKPRPVSWARCWWRRTTRRRTARTP